MKRTTEGRITRPWSSGKHSATPLRTEATSECVVPRSMPTAMRRWCGSGDWPGSEICNKAMVNRENSGQLVEFSVHFLCEALDEHQRPHLPHGLYGVFDHIQQIAKLLLHAPLFCGDFVGQGLQAVD